MVLCFIGFHGSLGLEYTGVLHLSQEEFKSHEGTVFLTLNGMNQKDVKQMPLNWDDTGDNPHRLFPGNKIKFIYRSLSGPVSSLTSIKLIWGFPLSSMTAEKAFIKIEKIDLTEGEWSKSFCLNDKKNKEKVVYRDTPVTLTPCTDILRRASIEKINQNNSILLN